MNIALLVKGSSVACLLASLALLTGCPPPSIGRLQLLPEKTADGNVAPVTVGEPIALDVRIIDEGNASCETESAEHNRRLENADPNDACFVDTKTLVLARRTCDGCTFLGDLTTNPVMLIPTRSGDVTVSVEGRDDTHNEAGDDYENLGQIVLRVAESTK